MLSKYIPLHFIEVYNQVKKKGYITADGTVMFADLSGFTNLSEKLTAKGKEGSEEVSRIINEIFEDLISIISGSGGSVYKFGGDAVTVFFPKSISADAVVRTAVSMQGSMKKFDSIQTIAGRCSVSMKIGIACGESVIGMVGEDIKQYFIAGDTLDSACDCEHKAEKGEIIVYDRKIGFLKIDQTDYSSPDKDDTHRKKTAGKERSWFKNFIDRELSTREEAGALEKGELRNCAVVFINFSGVGYDEGFDYGLLNAFYSMAASTVKKYHGFINKIDMGDKGNKIIALFGAPVSTEKNEEYALRAVQEIRDKRPDGISLKAGVNNGNIYFGVVGASHRREFTVMGAAVNLSARLMGSAAAGEVIVSGSVRRKVPEVETGGMKNLRLKGVTDLFEAYDLIRVLETRKSKRFRLIGRKKELEEYASVLYKKKAAVICIKAEAGLGKSVLVNKLFEERIKNSRCYLVNCLSYTKNNTYFAVREFILKFAGIDMRSTEKEKLSKLSSLLKDSGEEGGSDLFAAFFGFGGDNERINDPSLKDFFYETCLSIFNTVVNKRKAVLFLEDAHWIDSASADLLRTFAGMLNPKDNTCSLHMVFRPDAVMNIFENCDNSFTLELKNLESDDGKEFLKEKFSLAAISERIYSQIFQKTKGNPFFMEEIILGLKNDGCLVAAGEPAENSEIDDRFMSERDKKLTVFERSDVKYRIKPSIKTISIPDNVNDIVLARIDKLDENSRTVLKVASVIGRVFQIDVLKRLQDLRQIAADLDIKDSLFDLTKVDLTLFEENSDNEYLFKHAITQEVAYETLLFSLRRKYHLSIARLYESSYRDDLSSAYELLAFHYRHSTDRQKARLYLLKSAGSAKAKFRYKEAFDFLKLYRKYKMPPEEKLESYFIDLELYKHTERSKKAMETAEKIMTASAGKYPNPAEKAFVKKLNLLRRLGDYPEAQKMAESGKKFKNHDTSIEFAIESGFLFFRTGDLDKMKKMIRRASKLADLSHNSYHLMLTENLRGMYHHIKRDFAKALKSNRAMLDLCEKNGFINEKFTALQNMAALYGQTGKMEEAEKYFSKTFSEAKRIKNYKLLMQALDGLARVSYIKGSYKTSEKYIKEGIRLVERSGRIHLKELMLQNLFNIRLDEGNLEEASELCDERQRILEITKDKMRLSILNDNRGDTLFRMGKYDEAITVYKANIEFSVQIGNIEMVGHGYGNLANCYAEKGDIQKSIVYYEKQIDYSVSHNDIHSEGKALFNLAYTYFEDMKDADKASETALKAKKVFEKIGYKHGLDSVNDLLKRIKEIDAERN